MANGNVNGSLLENSKIKTTTFVLSVITICTWVATDVSMKVANVYQHQQIQQSLDTLQIQFANEGWRRTHMELWQSRAEKLNPEWTAPPLAEIH